MKADSLRYTRCASDGSARCPRLDGSSPLTQFVDCLWIQCGYGQPHVRERVLPTGTADLIFAVDATGGARSSSIAGPRSASVDLDTSRPFSAIGIHFKPGGASPFFGTPLSELRDRGVTLDLLWVRLPRQSLTDAQENICADDPGPRGSVREHEGHGQAHDPTCHQDRLPRVPISEQPGYEVDAGFDQTERDEEREDDDFRADPEFFGSDERHDRALEAHHDADEGVDQNQERKLREVLAEPEAHCTSHTIHRYLADPLLPAFGRE